jgi:hypothetical protein
LTHPGDDCQSGRRRCEKLFGVPSGTSPFKRQVKEMVGEIRDAFSPREFRHPFPGDAGRLPEGSRQLTGNGRSRVGVLAQICGKQYRITVT